MFAFLKTGLHQRLDLLLSVVMTFEVFVYFAAALLHLGIRMRVGSLVLAVPDAILPASIVETILGLAVASNLAVLLASKRQSIRITHDGHSSFCFGWSIAGNGRVGHPCGSPA